MKLIGLSGTNGSGKDTIAHILRDEYGWCFADATTILGNELTKRGLPHERANKAALSAEWRREYGMAMFIEMGIKLYESGSYDGLVISSLRHPAEADRLHELGGSVVWVDADPRVRYARITSANRGRVEDNKTYEQFLAEQETEMNGKPDDPAALKVSAVKERADIFIENDGDDIDAFKRQVMGELQKAGLI